MPEPGRDQEDLSGQDLLPDIAADGNIIIFHRLYDLHGRVPVRRKRGILNVQPDAVETDVLIIHQLMLMVDQPFSAEIGIGRIILFDGNACLYGRVFVLSAYHFGTAFCAIFAHIYMFLSDIIAYSILIMSNNICKNYK